MSTALADYNSKQQYPVFRENSMSHMKLRERTKAHKHAVEGSDVTSVPRKRPNIVKKRPLPFLELPREIRDIVYHEIWRFKAPFQIFYRGTLYAVKYEALSPKIETVTPLQRTRARRSKPRNPWILANKQVLNEAIEQFQRKAIW